MEMTPPQVRLPRPHLIQHEIKHHPAKRKVVNAGRRSGKTTLAAEMAVERFLRGQRVLVASTTQEQADVFWDLAKRWLGSLLGIERVRKNEQRRILEMHENGGRIRVKTGSDADVLRGDYADFLVLDECALLDPRAWQEVGAPMLLDTDGDALFISTPKGNNWFRDLYERGLADDGRWKSWHFTSHDNPFLSKEALEDLAQDMPVGAVEQELEAQFIDLEGMATSLIPYSKVREAAEREYVTDPLLGMTFGVDVARFGDDKSVVGARQNSSILWLEDWAKADTTETVWKVVVLMQRHHPDHVVVDVVGVGAGVYDQLRHWEDWGMVETPDGVEPYRPRFTAYNAGEKARNTERFANRRAEDYVGLAKRFEDGDIDIPQDQELKAQLSSLRYKFNSRRQMLIESKDEMKRRGLLSPDKADAVCLSFQQYAGTGIWLPED